MEPGIKVISHSQSEVIAQYSAYSLMGNVFTLIGVVTLIGCYFFMWKYRASIARPGIWQWFFPSVLALPPLIYGIYAASSSTMVQVSAETGTLVLHETVAGFTLKNTTYPLTKVQGVRVGTGSGCLFLYAVIADGSMPVLMPCTDRRGYDQVANALNSFLNSLATQVPQEAPSQ